jgi:hypothetical protein
VGSTRTRRGSSRRPGRGSRREGGPSSTSPLSFSSEANRSASKRVRKRRSTLRNSSKRVPSSPRGDGSSSKRVRSSSNPIQTRSKRGRSSPVVRCRGRLVLPPTQERSPPGSVPGFVAWHPLVGAGLFGIAVRGCRFRGSDVDFGSGALVKVAAKGPRTARSASGATNEQRARGRTAGAPPPAGCRPAARGRRGPPPRWPPLVPAPTSPPAPTSRPAPRSAPAPPGPPASPDAAAAAA